MLRQTHLPLDKPGKRARTSLALLCVAVVALLSGLPAALAAPPPQLVPQSAVTRSSVITTFAGNGFATSGGDGGQAAAATLNTPADLAVDTTGNVYIADAFNHRIRRVAPDGVITTLAGTGEAGADGDGGPATDARLRTPLGVALSADGVLYIADTYNHRIRAVTADGIISTIAGTGEAGFSGDGGPATDAQLAYPTGIAIAPDGAVYIADTRNHRVRKLAADGAITTVAGAGAPGFSGDGGPATLARLNSPRGVAVSADGTLYIVDRENRRIRMVADDGRITTVAGNGSSGFNGDRGDAVTASLRAPYGVAVDALGNVYIADSFNHRVRQVSPSGTIDTVAGGDLFGFSGDGWPAGQAALHYPLGVAVDIAGNLYIADSFNHRVRKVWNSAPNAPTPNLFL